MSKETASSVTYSEAPHVEVPPPYTAQGEPGLTISDEERIDIENESRELPAGWVCDYDRDTGRAFYVYTFADPPTTSWIHPYDDPNFLRKLPGTHPAAQYYAQQEVTRAEDGKSPTIPTPKPTNPVVEVNEKKTLAGKVKGMFAPRQYEPVKDIVITQAQYDAWKARRSHAMEAPPKYTLPKSAFPRHYLQRKPGYYPAAQAPGAIKGPGTAAIVAIGGLITMVLSATSSS